MKLTNSIVIESGVVGFLPTSLGYNRRLKKQAEKMEAAQRAWKVQQQKIAEGKRKLKDLELDTWWDECSREQQQQARLICVQVGYDEARRYVKEVGLHGYRCNRHSRVTGIYY